MHGSGGLIVVATSGHDDEVYVNWGDDEVSAIKDGKDAQSFQGG
jgi:hypothetical protein